MRAPRPNTRISEELARTVLPDSVLARMLEEDVIRGPYKPPRPLVRRRKRWVWVAGAVAITLMTAAFIKGMLA